VSPAIDGIGSMATRALLAELAGAYQRRSGVAVHFASVGGVDAARRVQAGEASDGVVLAAETIDSLVAAGRVVAGSRVDLVHSGVAIAVRAGAARPDISTQHALRQALLSARTVGCSSGPSGVALSRLFARWGLYDRLRERIVQAPVGVPVGALVASGEVELGFQQLSELMHLEGIDVLGPMPRGVEIVTTFSGACCATSSQPEAVSQLLDFLRSGDAAQAKNRHGMAPA
jgi:molybdate transport system substrate-binding protein